MHSYVWDSHRVQFGDDGFNSFRGTDHLRGTHTCKHWHTQRRDMVMVLVLKFALQRNKKTPVERFDTHKNLSVSLPSCFENHDQTFHSPWVCTSRQALFRWVYLCQTVCTVCHFFHNHPPDKAMNSLTNDITADLWVKFFPPQRRSYYITPPYQGITPDRLNDFCRLPPPPSPFYTRPHLFSY